MVTFCSWAGDKVHAPFSAYCESPSTKPSSWTRTRPWLPNSENGASRARGATGGDLSVLLEAGAAQAEIIVSTLRTPSILEELLDYMGDTVPILVRVFEEWEAEWVEARGGTPISFSHAAGEAFMTWFAEERSSGPGMDSP